MQLHELIDREKARCECFRILAACFYQPERDVFLEEGTLDGLSSRMERVCPGAAPFVLKMKEAMLSANNEELMVEYARLFVGPDELKAAPYGSIYLEKGRQIMGDTTMEVAEYYHRNGLIIDADFKELPDHIAVELEFMYYLSFQEAASLEKEDMDRADHFLDSQEEFLRRFMSWVPSFCDQIKQSTESSYYASLAGCLSVFTESKAGVIPFADEFMKKKAQV